MKKQFSIEEIIIAVFDVMDKLPEDPDDLKAAFTGIKLVVDHLKDLAAEPDLEPEPAPAPKKSKKEEAPYTIVQPGTFSGYGAKLKRRTHEKLLQLKAEGKTIGDIVKMTGSQLDEDCIRAMLGARKLPFARWELLADAIGTKEEG